MNKWVLHNKVKLNYDSDFTGSPHIPMELPAVQWKRHAPNSLLLGRLACDNTIKRNPQVKYNVAKYVKHVVTKKYKCILKNLPIYWNEREYVIKYAQHVYMYV